MNAQNADDSVTANTVDAIRSGLRENDVVLMGAGTLRRLTIALRATRGVRRTLLVATALDEDLNDAYVAAGGRAGRFASLGEISDHAESRVRLAAYESEALDVLSVPQQHMWHAETCDSLRCKRPDALIVELCGVQSDLTEFCLRTRALVARVRHTLGNTPAILLVEPMGVSRLKLALGRPAPSLTRFSDPIPANVAMEFRWVRNDTDRYDRVLTLSQGDERGTVIISPSRGAAAQLVERLKTRQMDAGLYHAGLSHEERRAMLHAQASGRLKILVATEAIGVESSLSCPGHTIFTHPPVSPEIVMHFTGLAADVSYGNHFVILWSENDIDNLPMRAASRALTKERVLQTASMLSRRASRGYVVIPKVVDSSPRFRTRQSRPMGAETSLLALELAGSATRRDDVPRGATVTASGDAQPAASSSLKLPTLRAGIPTPVDMLRLSSKLGVLPDDLQRELLRLQRAGRLVFRGHGRESMYILNASSSDAVRRVERILAGIQALALSESQRMSRWLLTRACRVESARKLFGGEQAEPCGRCDRCTAQNSRLESGQSSAVIVALTALAALPFRVRQGVAHRVIAAAFAEPRRTSSVEDVRSLLELLEQMKLVRRLPDEGGGMLIVTAAGHRAIEAGRGAGRPG